MVRKAFASSARTRSLTFSATCGSAAVDSAPTNSENNRPPVHDAIPVRPFAVATSLSAKTSIVSVFNKPDMI